MKKALLTLFLLFVGLAIYAQVTLSGKTIDAKGEPVPSVIVIVKKNGVIKANTLTDFDGLYRITNIDPGNYDVEFQLLGYSTQVNKNVKLTNGIITLDGKMAEDSKLLGTVEIVEYKVPIVKVDQTSTGGTITSDQIAKLPTKDISGLVATAAPGVAVSANGTINIKGARSNQTNFYIDGIRVSGSMPPPNEIEQLEVITGGLEAKYGDVTGGIISLTTKGPSNKFSGGLELETSQYLDPYGYNFVNGNITGPILSRTITDKSGGQYKESLIGFRLAGQYRYQKDANPPALPVYKVKDDVLAELEKNPITQIGGGTAVPSAELLQAEDYELLKYRPNNDLKRYDLVGKLDFKLAKAIDLTITGTYNRFEDKFTPANWQVFNSANNPTNFTNNYRTIARLRHRLGTPTEGGGKTSGLSIENAQYSLQAGYEKNLNFTYDKKHKDRFFDYGYVGQYDTRFRPFFENEPDTLGNIKTSHTGFLEQFVGYKRADINPVLANFNNDLSGGINIYNGLYNLGNLATVWGLHQNVGSVYNSYTKGEGAIMTGVANLSFDIIPKGAKDKAHNLQLGFVYEQRDDRNYILAPFGLWNYAGQLQNVHINGFGVDTTKILGDTLINGAKVNIYSPDLLKDVPADNQFYKRYREKVGLPLTAFGNVSNLTPDQMSLDLFSAFELAQQGFVDYYGYDYLGNKQTGNITFKDFFTKKDANGVRTFPVAPQQPLYIAGYIQDKFRYKDMIMSLGFRVDRFDANTKVLKDPYSLYEIMTAKEYYETKLKLPKPDNIADDYLVYLSQDTRTPNFNYENKPDIIRAFRKGDQWYSNKGEAVNPDAYLGVGTKTYAKFKVDGDFPQIRSLNYDPDLSFTDYKPQLNFMPRLAFSFPISDVANFFAHYDVLVARPTNNYVTALDYLFFDLTNRTPENNANLKPEKTIDYEVGFQQKLTNSSGIKFAAYYKEMRDMIQLRFYKYITAPLAINEYSSYSNLDFGTIKGFTFQYDLRPTNHVSANVNYTLQFADGTGSDPASQRDINRRNGNIRTLSPLNFDERHRIVATIDYRYDGLQYDGPKLFGAEILRNAGANLQVITVSGRPFTKRQQPQPFGGTQLESQINGARLPWTFNLDLRIDKTFSVSKNPKNPLDVNVYLRVQNLLDTRNVAGVYSATGSPDDDGYLQSSFGQGTLENIEQSRGIEAVRSYQQSYLMRLLNPGNYYLPRRIFLGASFNF